MTEHTTPPPGDGPPGDRHAVDVGALERAVTALGPVAEQLRLSSTRLVHSSADPGEPPASEHVLELQQSASDALLALARGLDESAGLLSVVARHYRGSEEDLERTLRRMSGGAP